MIARVWRRMSQTASHSGLKQQHSGRGGGLDLTPSRGTKARRRPVCAVMQFTSAHRGKRNPRGRRTNKPRRTMMARSLSWLPLLVVDSPGPPRTARCWFMVPSPAPGLVCPGMDLLDDSPRFLRKPRVSFGFAAATNLRRLAKCDLLTLGLARMQSESRRCGGRLSVVE